MLFSSVFFESDENLKKLYESVSNRKIRVEDIERVALEEGKSFETQITNDLGFLVKNPMVRMSFCSW